MLTIDIKDFHSKVKKRELTQYICLSGTLIVQGDDCYLATDENPETAVVRINMPSFRKTLLKSVPCWVGGPFLYKDAATATGTLSSNSHNPIGDSVSNDHNVHNHKEPAVADATPELTELTGLTLTREDGAYELTFD